MINLQTRATPEKPLRVFFFRGEITTFNESMPCVAAMLPDPPCSCQNPQKTRKGPAELTDQSP